MDHCDPYGYGMELRPNCASIVRDLGSYTFDDQEWMNKRSDCKEKPLNIYELHAGSWRTNQEDENGWYTYTELADILIPYLKEYGYNYIELALKSMFSSRFTMNLVRIINLATKSGQR